MTSAIRTFEGTVTKAKTFDAAKNIRTRSRAPTRLAALLAPGRVARLGLIIGGIEPGQLDALLHLADDPALVEFVLGAFVCDEVEQVRRDDHRAIVVADDDVAGE